MLADVLKSLRLLPFQDMMELAKALEGAMTTRSPTAFTIAGALAMVAEQPIQQSEVTTSDHRMLQDIFARRRSISVKSGNGVFEIELQTLHTHVVHADLRVGLSQAIDTIAAARALKGG
jgi:hypothetical protein